MTARLVVALFVFTSVISLGAGGSEPSRTPPEEFLTVAERSEWRATATHAEVVELLDALAASSLYARRASMGETAEGRDIPLLVIADPPLANGRAARASGKVVFFAFANIHAGEVCGKEALPMLAREILLAPDEPRNRALLDNLVLVLAPMYNADGNERVDPGNRPGQVGPELGMGVRQNAQGLDLNRDYVKLAAPETRAMVRMLNEWDPHVVMDLHTTNGSRHRYTLTYETPLHPASHPGPIAFARERMLPEASRRMEEEAGYATFYYGDFDADRTRWTTYDHRPRFGGNYHGLRNRVSILSEAYSYAPYKDRVLATLAFARLCAEFAAAHAAEIREVVRRADEETAALGRAGADDVPLRAEIAPFDEPVSVRAWADDAPGSEGWSVPAEIDVKHYGRFQPTRTVRRPIGYIVPMRLERVEEALRAHGVQVRVVDGMMLDTLRDRGATIEIARVDGVRRAERAFQGVRLVSLETTMRRERFATPPMERALFYIPMHQPLGTLAAILLEPESDDGFAAWGFYDDELAEGRDFPIVRVVAME